MNYKISALRNGGCVIAGNHAFYKGNPDERYDYMLFLWLIEGGEKPILVDSGLHNVEEMNQGAAQVLALRGVDLDGLALRQILGHLHDQAGF